MGVLARLFTEAAAAGRADAVTYNTAIKVQVQSGNLQCAPDAVGVMRAASVQPRP